MRMIPSAVLLLAALTGADPAPAQSAAPPRATLAALAVDEDLRADGRLDEPAWARAPVSDGFLQREPDEYAPSTERTEVRVVYTPSTLYIAVSSFDSAPDGIVAKEMARDAFLFRDDSIGLFLDTFHDRRNAFFFETNPNGARTDALITDEGRDFNLDWDGVWTVGTERNAEGWTAEFAIPFATLRFPPALDTWGLNVRRIIRRKNEETYLSPIGLDANVFRISRAADLTGLSGLRSGLALQVEPFAVVAESSLGSGAASGEGDEIDAGIDLKWGVTRTITVDLTVNTDFAESEVDDQQFNLTRFPLFFPEKREFFLENAGIFEFGPTFAEVPLFRVFFSRRIGIADDGREVPIEWGARMTGRTGDWSFGLLDVQTDSLRGGSPNGAGGTPENNWGTVRVKRNLGGRSNVGMIVTHRDGERGEDNTVLGADADIKVGDNLSLWAFATESDGGSAAASQEWAGGAGATWDGAIWDAEASALEIGDGFNPEMGFLLRGGVRRYRGSVLYQPRPEDSRVRNYLYGVTGDVFTFLDGDLATIDSEIDLFGVRFQTEDQLVFFAKHRFERLRGPFPIFPGVVIAGGDYRWNEGGLFFATSDGRPLIGSGQLSFGEFFDGDALIFNGALTWRASRNIATETSLSHNDISLPAGAFEVNVVRQRLAVTLSPELALNGIAQYNDAAELLGLNLRLDWIYRPGSNLFVVFNQNWNAPSVGDLSTQERQVILKLTFLVLR